MTQKERTAIENDLRELMEMINPAHVKVWRLTPKDGCSLCLQLDVTGIRTWVVTKNNSRPHLTDNITIYVDCPNGYPEKKILVYYGSEKWPAHVNVFASDLHPQCIDAWGRYSSIASAVRKTLHAIAFDPAVTKYESMANSSFKSFMQQHEREFPCTAPRLLCKSVDGVGRGPRVHI